MFYREKERQRFRTIGTSPINVDSRVFVRAIRIRHRGVLVVRLVVTAQPHARMGLEAKRQHGNADEEHGRTCHYLEGNKFELS